MKKEKQKIEIGKIVKAVGIKGEVKILSFSDEPDRFNHLDKAIIGNTETSVEKARIKDNTPIVKFEVIKDRNMAESIVGTPVYMWEEDLEELPEGTYYIRDLIGCTVVDEAYGEIGTLEDVLTNRPQQLYKVKSPEGKEIFFPWVDEFKVGIFLEAKIIKVRLPEGLLDI